MVEVQLLQKLCIKNIIKNWSYFIGVENFTLPEQYLLDFLECCVENNEISIIHQVLLTPHVSKMNLAFKLLNDRGSFLVLLVFLHRIFNSSSLSNTLLMLLFDVTYRMYYIN